MPRKKLQPTTSYYRWDGDACRKHVHPNGSITADLYRAGRGIVPIPFTELDYAVEISRKAYIILVEEEYQLRRDSEPKAPDVTPSSDLAS